MINNLSYDIDFSLEQVKSLKGLDTFSSIQQIIAKSTQIAQNVISVREAKMREQAQAMKYKSQSGNGGSGKYSANSGSGTYSAQNISGGSGTYSSQRNSTELTNTNNNLTTSTSNTDLTSFGKLLVNFVSVSHIT
jgi:hypothetical protein